MKKLIILLILSFFVVSCEGSSSSGGGGDGNSNNPIGGDNNSPIGAAVPEEYRGEWLFIHSGEKVYLGTHTARNLVYTDKNIITVKTAGYDEYLIRAGQSAVNIHGSVYGDRAAPRASSTSTQAIGGMDNVWGNLINTKAPEIRQDFVTDPNGNFNVPGLPGGSYNVNVGDMSMIIEEINNDNNDIGVITVVNGGCNIKSSLNMNAPFVYGDYTEYKGTVRMTNVGDEDCLGLTYNITSADNIFQSLTFTNQAGTVTPGSYKDIPVTMVFKYIKTNRQQR